MTGSGNGNNNADFWVTIASIGVGILFAIKQYDENPELKGGRKWRKLIVGSGGSLLTVWTLFELMLYIGLPMRLSLCLAGLGGYAGAEVFVKMFLKFVEKKFDVIADEPIKRADENKTE